MALETQTQPQKSWPLVVGAIGFVVIAGFSLYYSITLGRIEDRIATLTQQKSALSAASRAENGTRATTRAYALEVQQKLKSIEAKQLAWSLIASKIENTFPRLGESSQSAVMLRSYTGTSEGRIILSATTRADTIDAFADVAQAIRAFATAPSFAHVFVPSITKSLTPEGTTVLSFSMNLEYVGGSVDPVEAGTSTPAVPVRRAP